MLDIHYELRYPIDKVSDSLKEAHNRLTQKAKQLIENYIRLSMRFVDWSKATMKDICDMVSHVIKELNATFSVFNTNIESTIVSGKYPKREYTLTANNTWDTFDFLSDSSYNRLKFIIQPVAPINISDFFNRRKNFEFIQPDPLMAFPESNPDSLFDDELDLMELGRDIVADKLISTEDAKSEKLENPFKWYMEPHDGERLYGSDPLIHYEFDAPLAPIN